MALYICGIIALVILAATVVAVVLCRKDLRKAVRLLSVGFFALIFVAIAPCHVGENGYSFGTNTFDTICVMITQSNLNDTLTKISAYDNAVSEAYKVLVISLYILGPLSVASATLSFVKGFGKAVYYIKSSFADSYVFSCVNERSVAVAKSVRKQHPKAVILFALDGGVDGVEEKDASQLEEISAIVIHKNIKDVSHRLNRKRHYCLLDKDSAQNIESGLALNDKFKDNKSASVNVELLIYSTDEMSQIIFYNTPHNVTIHLFREEEIIADDLIFNYPLYGGVVDGKLNVLIVGAGKIGYEILKKTIWSGYLGKKAKTQINMIALDAEAAESKLKKECPGLDGVKIGFYNADINGVAFAEKLDKIDRPTYIVVALGNEKLNAETSIYLRRHFGSENGFPKIHMATDTEDYAEKLKLISVHDWKVGADRSFYKRADTEQNFEIKGFGSYESAYRHIYPAESSFGLLALACHVVKMNLPQNADGEYRNSGETAEQFIRSLSYSYNQISFTKNNADQLALSIGYLLYALDYPEKRFEYLENVRKDLGLKSVYDIPYALYVDPDYDLESELKTRIDEIYALTTERYDRFMYTLGWTNLPVSEIKNKSTRDQLRMRYARIGDYDINALEKLINEGEKEQKHYRQNDVDEIYKIPRVLQIFKELSKKI